MALKRILFCLITILLPLGCVNLHAQKLQAKLSHYSTDDGLLSNAICKILQDDYGYIWIGTWNGLSRFDGNNFFNYQTGAISHIPNLHNRIYDLTIDSQQNIWMRMYDNRVFVLKRSTDRIINPFSDINGSEEYRTKQPVVVTSNGDVLVVINDVGIYKMRLDQNNVNWQLITTAGLNITSLAEGYQGDIWLGTNQGVHRMDASNLTLERKGIFTEEEITCLFSNGYNIFAGTKSGRIMTFSYGQESSEIRHGGHPINSIFVDSHGLIWFSDSEMGCYRINPETGNEKKFVQTVKVPDYDGSGGFFREANGIVWIRMNHGGYGYYDREEDEVEYFHNDPSNPWNLSNTVNATLELDEGVVWESTSRRGLDKLEIMKKSIGRKQLIPQAGSTLENEIRGLFYDKATKELYIANKNNALFVFKEDGSHTVLSKDDKGNPLGRIYGISQDKAGNLWLSSKDNGLFKMTKSNGSVHITNFRHNDNDPQSLSDDHAYLSVEDNSGNIWVATYGGGVNVKPAGTDYFLNPHNKIRGYPHNSYMKVRTVAIDNSGDVWAGTTDGILIMSYDKKDGVKVRKLEPSEEKPDDILRSNDVVCLTPDSLGLMWVGTNGGGLAHATGKDSQGRWLFESFGAKDGLPSEEIKSITLDGKGNTWFATDHIICSYNTEKRIFSTFSTLEGVDETLCSEGSAISLPNGDIIFGTIDGYYIVEQKKLINTIGSIIKLRFTDFWLDDELQSPRLNSTYDYYVPDSKEVALPSHNSKISIRFASLNYQLQHRVHYQYMLEGYDTEWKNAGKDRMATYSSLPSGTYQFVVRAFLLESSEKYDEKVLTIIVPSPFLSSSNSIWLYMALFAIICIAILLLLQRRVQRQIINNSADSSNTSGDQLDNSAFFEKLNGWMENHFNETDLTEDKILEMMQMNRADFEDSLSEATGKSPKAYILDFRMRKAKQFLEQTNDNIEEIAFSTGFKDTDQFNRLFVEATGMTPTQYRDRNQHNTDGATDEYEIIE